MQRLSYNKQIEKGNGNTTTFKLDFDYYKAVDVEANILLNNIKQNINYNVSNKQIVFANAPPVNSIITITRNTNLNDYPILNYNEGSVYDKDLFVWYAVWLFYIREEVTVKYKDIANKLFNKIFVTINSLSIPTFNTNLTDVTHLQVFLNTLLSLGKTNKLNDLHGTTDADDVVNINNLSSFIGIDTDVYSKLLTHNIYNKNLSNFISLNAPNITNDYSITLPPIPPKDKEMLVKKTNSYVWEKETRTPDTPDTPFYIKDNHTTLGVADDNLTHDIAIIINDNRTVTVKINTNDIATNQFFNST